MASHLTTFALEIDGVTGTFEGYTPEGFALENLTSAASDYFEAQRNHDPEEMAEAEARMNIHREFLENHGTAEDKINEAINDGI